MKSKRANAKAFSYDNDYHDSGCFIFEILVICLYSIKKESRRITEEFRLNEFFQDTRC